MGYAMKRDRRPGRAALVGLGQRGGAGARHRLRPVLLVLEDRRLLSTFTVTSTADDGSTGTLRWAVALATSDTSPSTIDLELGTAPAAITLSQGQLELSDTAESVTISDGPGQGPVTISGNNASRVFQVDQGVTATLSGLTIAGGSTSGNGGGLDNFGTTTLSGCTISGNRSVKYGGGLYNEKGGTAALSGCTISGNSAVFGGGLENVGTVTLSGCTISGNSANYDGGLGNYNGQVTLTDCTISGNSAHSGGGVGIFGGTADLTACSISDNTGSQSVGGLYGSGTTTLTDTIVAGNSGSGGHADDVSGNVTGSFNLIGSGGSGGIQGGTDGNIVLAGPGGMGLAPLSDNGGPNQTMALTLGSPALGAGTAIVGLTNDQRGQPLDSPNPDIGAYQTQPGLVPASRFTVNSTADDGSTGTLRWAVEWANRAASPSTIDIELGTAAATISLSQGQLELSNTATSIAIANGPGDGPVTISGNNASRVFQVDQGTTASLSGLTIAGGSVVRNGGGGLYNQGTVTLNDCIISGNSAAKGGGLDNYFGTAMLNDCTISGNSASYSGQGGGGGLANSGTATLNDCTISGNSAYRFGGGLANYASYGTSTATLTDCTIIGNSASAGGGLFNPGNGTMTLTDCTISANIANARHGGGLYNDGMAVLTNCTVSGNSADAGGGLYTRGVTTLTLTGSIVAGNVSMNPGAGAYSDLVEGGSSITGSYNLIGIGGGGYFRDGLRANTVLTSLAGLGLAPLGDYGGPTETMALLPGSLAIGTGTPLSGITTDQRGFPLDSPNVDIGAFQSQGFTLSAVAGSTPQTATVDEAFANPLAVTVTAKNPLEPVAGGLVNFAIDPGAGGAEATLSDSTATIGANGVAQVTARANATAGRYTVTASAAEAGTPVSLSLTNALINLTFKGTAAQNITFGTSNVTIAGTLSGGTRVPQGETVIITLGNANRRATIGSGGAFSATFDTASLNVSGFPYTITCAYATDGTFASTSTTRSLTVTRAATTVALASSGGSAVYGQSLTFVATVTAAAVIPGGTVTFLDGAFGLGNATLDGSGRATLTISGLTRGFHSITASYGGGGNFVQRHIRSGLGIGFPGE